jgi:hypothetical protein
MVVKNEIQIKETSIIIPPHSSHEYPLQVRAVAIVDIQRDAERVFTDLCARFAHVNSFVPLGSINRICFPALLHKTIPATSDERLPCAAGTNRGPGQCDGLSSLWPLMRAETTPSLVNSWNGLAPLLNTSQHSTPKDHTSLFVLYLRSRMLSGAIHLTGTCTIRRKEL